MRIKNVHYYYYYYYYNRLSNDSEKASGQVIKARPSGLELSRKSTEMVDFDPVSAISLVSSSMFRIKGVSFLRNCGAASVGEYNRVI